MSHIVSADPRLVACSPLYVASLKRRRFLNKVEVVDEVRSCGGWASVQEGCTVKAAFIRARKLASFRLKRREQQSVIVLVDTGT
jgi:hypothetical protein